MCVKLMICFKNPMASLGKILKRAMPDLRASGFKKGYARFESKRF